MALTPVRLGHYTAQREPDTITFARSGQESVTVPRAILVSTLEEMERGGTLTPDASNALRYVRQELIAERGTSSAGMAAPDADILDAFLAQAVPAARD